MLKFINSIAILFIFITTLFAQEQKVVDFFIAENPSKFEILDRYQQKISYSDKVLFYKFTPWKIIEENSLLSDQFTQAMKVEFNGKQYFFVRDDQGELKQEDEEKIKHIINDCNVFADSLIVIQNKAVLFSRIPFNEKNKKYKRNYLEKNTRLKTIFKIKNDYYVQTLDDKKLYGWIRPSGRLSLKRSTQKKFVDNNDSQIDEDLKNRLLVEVKKLNRIYLKLFKKLNSDFSQNRSVPFWSLESNEKGMVLQLQNNHSEKYIKSIKYFVNEVETIIAGSSYSVFTSGSAIEIIKN